MKKIRSYISLLMLALLLLPVADKALHDLEHVNDLHCDVKGLHYCKAEHFCAICDYVFSSSATPPRTEERLSVFVTGANDLKPSEVFNTLFSLKFTVSLRGPPLV